MHYEKIILDRIICFLRRYLYGWLLVSPVVASMRTSCAGDPATAGCGSHTGACASACGGPTGSSAQTGPQLNHPGALPR